VAKTRPTETEPPATKDRQFVTALARGLTLLGCFSAARPELTGSELARLSGLPQPTVWRLCHTMLEMGVLVALPGDKLRPGLPALRLGHSVLAGLGIAELARPHMQAIADRFGGACGLGARDGLDMVFLQRCESDSRLLLNLRVGSRVPIATSALGWAYLAGQDAARRARIVAELRAKDGERWAEAQKPFEKALADAAAQGGCILNIGVFHKGYNTASVPVRAPDGGVAYALNCGSVAATLPPAKLRAEVAPRLVALARLLEDTIGARAAGDAAIGAA
jgi:DNA-binding IclR family transcriptional regulator